MKGEKTVSGVLAGVLAASLAASLCLTYAASRAHHEREDALFVARMGVEDVAQRVERSVRNLATVRAMNQGVALAKVRALAELIAENPDVLKPGNRAKFDAYADLLAVQELHVTDGRGVFVRCLPPVYEGMDIHDSAQSAAFLPALTNAAFALVQAPQRKGLATGSSARDSMYFQYAGVARRDAPGLVQVGYDAVRVAEAEKLADIDGIASTARIGPGGHVTIVKAGAGRAAEGLRYGVDAQGRPCTIFETDVAGYRVIATLPGRAGWFESEGSCGFFVVLDLLLVLLLGLTLPAVRNLLVQNVRDLTERLGARARRKVSPWRRTGPLAAFAACVFVFVLAVLAWVEYGSARSLAKERLRAAAADILGDLDDCVDAQLVFVGQVICQHYKAPALMAQADLAALERTYSLDEINVVDGNGRCLASTVPAIVNQDQWSKANPARFCQALIKDGKVAFSQPFRESATERGVFRKYVGVAFPSPAKGYVQIGFDRSRLDGLDFALEDLAHEWHIGETGFFVVARKGSGKILSAGRTALEGRTCADAGFDMFTAQQRNNADRRDPVSCDFLGFSEVHYFESSFGGERCLCTTGLVNDFHRYVAALPLKEVYGPVRELLLGVAITLFVVLTGFVVGMSRLSGLVAEVRENQQRDRERSARDMTLAKTIQLSSLTAVFPDTPEWSVRARMDTAREVGGDFYDFYELPSGRLCVLVADVSGKGIPAALFMMRAKATLRAAVTARPDDLAAAVTEANDALAEKNEAEMFVTAWVGVYDAATHALEYVNAGHNPPIVKHADGTVSWMRGRSGLVLAAMGGVPYRTQRIVLARGDRLLLYTDGVTEAMNGAGVQYGEPRLEKVVREPGSDLVAAVRADITLFVAGAEPSDDITMVEFDVKV